MKKKVVSIILVLVMTLTLFPSGAMAFNVSGDPITEGSAGIDILINAGTVSSILASDMTPVLLAKINQKLATASPQISPLPKVRIQSNAVLLDTTDVSKWYVYDHYDTGYYSSQSKWQESGQVGYGADPKLRQYYANTQAESGSYNTSTGQVSKTNVYPMVTLKNYLKTPFWGGYNSNSNSTPTLGAFNQHIYTGLNPITNSGMPQITFVGYASAGYQDFMVFPCASSEDKQVTFDIDSSAVNAHSLDGAGFLINSSITGTGSSAVINGYLLFYRFIVESFPGQIQDVSIYKLKDVNVNALHNTTSGSVSGITRVFGPIAINNSNEWASQMSITLDISTTSLSVTQKVKGAPDSSARTVFHKVTLEKTGNGFGPYVGYAGNGTNALGISSTHNCVRASAFTYSNISMAYINQSDDIFDVLAQANYVQNADLYFVDLTDDGANRNSTSDLANVVTQTNKAAGYMQAKKIRYISNHTNVFLTDGTLAAPAPLGQNGLTVYSGGTTGETNVETLAEAIATYIVSQYNKPLQNVDQLPLSNPVALFTLVKDVSDAGSGNSYVDIIKRELVGSGIAVFGFDERSIGSSTGGSTAPISEYKYTLVKPGGATSTYVHNEENLPLFTVTKNKNVNVYDWPAGDYTVTLVVKDNTGKSSTPVSVSFTVIEDIIPPAIPTVTLAQNGSLSFNTSDIGGWGVAAYQINTANEVSLDSVTAASQTAAQAVNVVGTYALISIPQTIKVYDVAGNYKTVTLPGVTYSGSTAILNGFVPSGNYGALGTANASGTINSTAGSTKVYTYDSVAVTFYIPPNNCVITANVGTDGGGSASGGGTVINGTGFSLTAQAFTGYTFKGWYDNATGNGSALGTALTYTATAQGNAEYFAVFVRNTYDVNLTASSGGIVQIDGGTAGSSAGKTGVVHGTDIELTATADTVGGYAFVSWSDGDGNAIRTVNVTAPVTLSAIFKKLGSVTFDPNGGTPVNDITEIITDAKIGTLPTPAKQGCTFSKWVDTQGTTVTENTLMVDGGIAASAVWVPDPLFPYRVGEYGYKSINLAIAACETVGSEVYGQKLITVISDRIINGSNGNPDSLMADGSSYGDQLLKDGYSFTSPAGIAKTITLQTGGSLQIGEQTGTPQKQAATCNHPLGSASCTCIGAKTINVSLVINGGMLMVDGQMSKVELPVTLYPGNYVKFISDTNNGNYFNLTLVDNAGTPITSDNPGQWTFGDSSKVKTDNAASMVADSADTDGDSSDTDVAGDESYNLMGGRVKITNTGITLTTFYDDPNLYLVIVEEELSNAMLRPFAGDPNANAYDSLFAWENTTVGSAINDITTYNNGKAGAPNDNNVYILGNTGANEAVVLRGDNPDSAALIDFGAAGKVNNTIRLISAVRVVTGVYGTVIQTLTENVDTHTLYGPVSLVGQMSAGTYYPSVWLLDNIRVDNDVTVEIDDDCYIKITDKKIWSAGEVMELTVDDPESKIGDVIVDFSDITATDIEILARFTLENDGYYLAAGSGANANKLVIAKATGTPIFGSVVNGTGNQPGVKITVWRGGEEIGSPTYSNAEGNFAIYGVQNGIYNIVFEYDDGISTTIVTRTITLPNDGDMGITVIGRQSTRFQSSATAPVQTVSNLDEVFDPGNLVSDPSLGVTQDDLDVVSNGGSVEVRLVASETADSDQVVVLETLISSKGKVIGAVFDLSAYKDIYYFDGNTSLNNLLKELNNLVTVEIEIPAAIRNKSGYAIYRYHNSTPEFIPQDTPTVDGEYFIISGNTIFLTIRKFSAYAIAYNKNMSNPSGGNTGGGKWAVNVTQSPAGTVTVSSASIVDGGSVTLTITPKPGAYIIDVKINGVSVGAVDTYKLTNINADVAVDVIFAWGLPYWVGGNGVEGEPGKLYYLGFSSPLSGEMKWLENTGKTILFRPNPKSFDDLVDGHWGVDAINFVTERELFIGVTPELFMPDTGMTRAMFATVIGRLHERSNGLIDEANEKPFDDVPVGQWYTKYISWADQNGIVLGIGGGKFAPDREITREEMAAILARYITFAGLSFEENNSGTQFDDSSSVSGWASKAVADMKKYSIINGIGDNIFAPGKTATRAEVSQILKNFIELAVK